VKCNLNFFLELRSVKLDENDFVGHNGGEDRRQKGHVDDEKVARCEEYRQLTDLHVKVREGVFHFFVQTMKVFALDFVECRYQLHHLKLQ
jgi:hypothetical protein